MTTSSQGPPKQSPSHPSPGGTFSNAPDVREKQFTAFRHRFGEVRGEGARPLVVASTTPSNRLYHRVLVACGGTNNQVDDGLALPLLANDFQVAPGTEVHGTIQIRAYDFHPVRKEDHCGTNGNVIEAGLSDDQSRFLAAQDRWSVGYVGLVKRGQWRHSFLRRVRAVFTGDALDEFMPSSQVRKRRSAWNLRQWDIVQVVHHEPPRRVELFVVLSTDDFHIRHSRDVFVGAPLNSTTANDTDREVVIPGASQRLEIHTHLLASISGTNGRRTWATPTVIQKAHVADAVRETIRQDLAILLGY